MPVICIDHRPNVFSTHLCYIGNFKLFLFTGRNSIILYKQLVRTYIQKSALGLFKLESSFRYLNNFSKFYRNFIFKAVGFLVLKGLGLKVQIVDNFLEFKLGYSHRCFVLIEKEIRVRVQKNLLFFQSVNKERLGNFLNRIKLLKKPDIYKGKGIWYKNEKIILKPVKKSK